MKNYTIELTEQEVNVLIDCLDIAVKSVGLKGSYSITVLAMNVSKQIEESKKEEANAMTNLKDE